MRRLLWIGVGVVLTAGVAVIAWPKNHFEVTTQSKTAYALYCDGVALLERVELMPARDKFLQAVQADSTFAMAYARLANCYMNISWRKEAEAAIAKAKQYAPRCSELEQLQITYRAQEQARQMKEAQATLDVLIAKYPDDPEVLYLHAVRLYDDGMKSDDPSKYTEAYALLKRCLAIDPTRINCHNILGYVESARGNFDDAIANLQRYAYYCPGQANPQDSLAEIYFMAGRYEEAINHYLEALRLNPAFYNSAVQLANVLSTTGQFSQAHQMLDTVKQVFVQMKQERQLEMAHIGVAFAACQWDTVLERTTKFLPFPAQPEVGALDVPAKIYSLRAFAQMELGRFADAAASLDARDAYWETVQRQKPPLLQERDLAEIGLYQKLMRARLMALQGRREQAAALASSALQSTTVPQKRLQLAFYPGVGETELRLGAYQDAADMARKALELIPTQPEANRVLGLALAKLGDNDGAQSALAIYLHVMRAADPGNQELDEARGIYDRLRAAS